MTFETKPEIALGQIHAARDAGLPLASVVADAGYGVDTGFRDAITALGLLYLVGIHSSTSLWRPGAPRLVSGRRVSFTDPDLGAPAPCLPASKQHELLHTN